ncbi:MAG: hypothetical protein WCI05_14865 [Myxococcales bacterium]
MSAISVGAFKLFGGGSTKQGAGIVVGSLDIGGETARSETMLREAGKVEGCNSTSDAEEQWADKGVQVALEAPEDTVSWSLHDKQGAFVCKLPCSRWLGPSSEYFVRRNEVKASGFEDIPVPAGFDVGVGQSVTVMNKRTCVHPTTHHTQTVSGSWPAGTRDYAPLAVLELQSQGVIGLGLHVHDVQKRFHDSHLSKWGDVCLDLDHA